MVLKLLLDTNAYVAMRRGDEDMRRLFRRSDGVFVSIVVVGELLYGFNHGSRRAENVEALERFLAQRNVDVLPVTLTTADRYARVATTLRRQGRPIPTNDIWIAAHALEIGADLVSYDDHFGMVDGLVWVRPGL